MLDRIPYEVFSDILANPELSIEDIVRCSGVCKSWYSLISSPAFVSLRSQKKNSLFLVRKYEPTKEDECFSIHLDDDTLSEYKSSSEYSFVSKQFPGFDIIECLVGVVCLSRKLNSYSTDDIVLWNPSIRKYVRLPQLYSSGWYERRSIGFGVDAGTNDFKVVRVSHYCSARVPRQNVEVYEISVGCWRTVTNLVVLRGGDSFGKQAFVNGAAHWVRRNSTAVQEDIVSFDFQEEVFRVIKLPDRQNVQCNLNVSVMGESLSLYCHESSSHCSIWVMKQYGVADSWTKLFTIDLSPLESSSEILGFPVIGFRRNGEALVMDGRALSWYDLNKKCLKRLMEFSRSMKFDVFSFTESVALLAVKRQTWDQRLKTLPPSSNKMKIQRLY